jgi:hypothetical protein
MTITATTDNSVSSTMLRIMETAKSAPAAVGTTPAKLAMSEAAAPPPPPQAPPPAALPPPSSYLPSANNWAADTFQALIKAQSSN